MSKRIKARMKNGFLKGTAAAALVILLIGMAAIDVSPMKVVIPAIIFPMMWLGLLGYAQVR